MVNMKRDIIKWTIGELKKYQFNIGYPDFQREPTVWNLDKKRSLIDSIFRGFDISPIYLYKQGEDSYDCIDGRQRINAILSFLGKNEGEGKDNKFSIKIDNEIYTDGGTRLSEILEKINGKKYDDLGEEKNIFDNYEINVIMIGSELDNVLELNLLFSRLQLGDTLNSGEKLHAMSGDMHDFIFKELPQGIRNHRFFQSIGTTFRRFAAEQISAQIVLNYFSLNSDKNDFTRSRYIDLQIFFKEKSEFSAEDIELTQQIRSILDKITKVFGTDLVIVGNRPIAVSTFLFSAYLINKGLETKLDKFKEFMKIFIATLKWQVKAYHNFESAEEYQDMLSGFQNYVTQATGESYAIRNRHAFLAKYFDHFDKHGEIIGDTKYNTTHEISADEERAKVVYRQLTLPDD
jgi:hypothetical protein